MKTSSLCFRKVTVASTEHGLEKVGVEFKLLIVSGLMFSPDEDVPEKTAWGNDQVLIYFLMTFLIINK